MTLLGQTDASVIGFVLNRIPLRGRGGYGYSYAYAYTEVPARTPRVPRTRRSRRATERVTADT
ncbi:MAG: hypothetical protein H0V33_02295 [Acidimicrobiia bacterium]|nr:hypothetical protein [Acidimicrobiia bacterium]